MFNIPSFWSKIIGDTQLPYVSEHAQYSIDLEHAMIHEGLAYIHSDIHAGMVNGTIFNHYLRVSSGTYPHVRGMSIYVTNAPFELTLYEASSVSAFGTEVSGKNCNRNSSNTPGVLVYHTPTVVVTGTLIDATIAPGGKQSGGLGEGPQEEWDLQTGVDYLLSAKNTSGLTADMSLRLFWYEPSDR